MATGHWQLVVLDSYGLPLSLIHFLKLDSLTGVGNITGTAHTCQMACGQQIISSKHAKRATHKYLSCAQSAVPKSCKIQYIPVCASSSFLGKPGKPMDVDNHMGSFTGLTDFCYQSCRYATQGWHMW